MKTIDLNAAADLYLGTSPETARAEGHRRFSTARAAIRFAMEQAAPVSLRGAILRAGRTWLTGTDIRALYLSDATLRSQPQAELEALYA